MGQYCREPSLCILGSRVNKIKTADYKNSRLSNSNAIFTYKHLGSRAMRMNRRETECSCLITRQIKYSEVLPFKCSHIPTVS